MSPPFSIPGFIIQGYCNDALVSGIGGATGDVYNGWCRNPSMHCDKDGSGHLGVGVDSDDAVDFGIGSEDAHDALVTLVRERRLKEHRPSGE